jgi:O-antigen/teichoic acid export membrane protein
VSSIKALAMRGAIWTMASYGMSMALRFGSSLLLTRLLLPDVYGLMALVYVLLTGLCLFSDIGLGVSIVQNECGDDPAFFNTVWTIQIIRGICLWVVSCLFAWPMATFYAEPQLLILIPVMGLTAIISGFDSTALATLSRHMVLGKLAIFELGVQVTSMTVTIVWAYFNPTVWALVAGGLISGLVHLIWGHRIDRKYTNRLAWDRDAAKSILSFGKWIFITTVLHFFVSQSDRLILGKLVSLETLGIYGIAFTLADIPRQIIMSLCNKVIFPSIAKMTDLPRETLRVKILGKRKYILMALAVGLSLLIGFGDRIIFLLYRSNYHEAGWMMPIIALGLWHTSLYSSMSPCLLALGKSYYNPPGFLFSFLTIAIGLPLAFTHAGMVAAMFVIAFYDFPIYLVTLYGLSWDYLHLYS